MWKMNVAYEKRYQDWRAQYDYLFAPENRSPQQDEQIPLTDGYSVRSKVYFHNGDLNLDGSENELLDKEGRVQYAWRNLDTDAEFCTMFCHSNGSHYLIFRTELYGYSVLEVESGREMHYVPACVHPEEGQEAEEVFIWTSADYDPDSDLLAVTGCIWACPYSIIVLDFSQPLQPQPPERWLDVRNIVDPDDSRFDHIEFARWEDGALVLRGSDAENGQWKEVRVSANQLRAELLEIEKKAGGTTMSQIASFYLLKEGQRQELPDGNCSGAVYMAIWDWCESELDLDVRFPAPQTEGTLDCALLEGELASDLLAALREQDLSELAAEIAPDWDLPAEAVQSGLETLRSHLELTQDGSVLLYEMT